MQGPCQRVATCVELFSSEYTHRDLKGGCYHIRTRSGVSRCLLCEYLYSILDVRAGDGDGLRTEVGAWVFSRPWLLGVLQGAGLSGRWRQYSHWS